MKDVLDAVASGRHLTRTEAERAFSLMMAGEATPSQIGAFLMGLRVRGETVDEIAAAVSVMRQRMVRVQAPAGAVDIVGTGGDASGSYNVSTCAAFVIAGAGVPVAKHGNRALSSKSGAADTLEALGVDLNLDADGISRCIRDAGIGFMFAPNHHSAMRHVGPSRVELGTRTVFNLLGPLSNPAGVTRQVVGVFSPEWVEPLAAVLRDLGTERAWVVHGDGLDELTVCGTTHVASVREGQIERLEVEPEQVGLARHDPQALRGGNAQDNAVALRGVLDGQRGAYRDIVALNAGAALLVAGAAADLRTGVERSLAAIDDGSAAAVLEKLVEVSRGQAN